MSTTAGNIRGLQAAAYSAPRAARVLIVPGLNDSGPAHWQTWLQAQHGQSLRVRQFDWSRPDLDRWASRISSQLDHAGDGPWIAVAHSFGCLALARHLLLHPDTSIAAALFVAPAEPDKFGVASLLPRHRLPVRCTMLASDTDPWMTASSAARWALRWGAKLVNLGDAGHINTESGHGPLPVAQRWVQAAQQQIAV